jgi:hypothetical protein
MDVCHMNCDEQADRETYRLMITRRRATELLLAANGSVLSLPRVEVRTGRRLAEQLTEAVRKEFGTEAYCLFVPGIVTAPENALGTKYALMESIGQNNPAPSGTYWVSSTAASGEAALPADEGAAVRSSLQEVKRYVAEPLSGPFARPGWIKELFQWAQKQLDPLGLRVTGSFQQLNASPTFSLIRMETGGPAVWFKATGEPNGHELPVTLTLTRFFPGYVPAVLGVHPSWNGWLSQEAEGSTLDSFTEISTWIRTAKTLAELQIASIGKSAELVESGCKDLRPSNLIQQVDPFLVHMSTLMATQKKQPPAILTDSQLQILSDELKDACSALRDLGLPHTLGHVDFNPGNILVSPETCIFLDWAEGCVTTPLITFEYLREHCRRHHLEDAKAAESIASAYLHPWHSFFSPEDLVRGMALTRLVAVFAYAVSSSTWSSSETLRNPALAGNLRSLTRRMHREAIRIRERSEPCLR